MWSACNNRDGQNRLCLHDCHTGMSGRQYRCKLMARSASREAEEAVRHCRRSIERHEVVCEISTNNICGIQGQLLQIGHAQLRKVPGPMIAGARTAHPWGEDWALQSLCRRLVS